MIPIYLSVPQIRALADIAAEWIVFEPHCIIAVARTHLLIVPWTLDENRLFCLRAPDLRPWIAGFEEIAPETWGMRIWDGGSAFSQPGYLEIDAMKSDVELGSYSRLIVEKKVRASAPSSEKIANACGHSDAAAALAPFAFDPKLLGLLWTAHEAFAKNDDRGELLAARLVRSPGPLAPTEWAIDTKFGAARFILMPMRHPLTGV